MRFYFFAGLMWIAIIVMCASIILVPVYMYLRNETYSWVWWSNPFYAARLALEDQRKRRKGK